MSTKAKYTKVMVQGKVANYAGYKVVGAVNDDVSSYLLLEKPDRTEPAKPRKAKARVAGPATRPPMPTEPLQELTR